VISDRPPTRAALRRNGLAIRRQIDQHWRNEIVLLVRNVRALQWTVFCMISFSQKQ